jgi:hypothetical protein
MSYVVDLALVAWAVLQAASLVILVMQARDVVAMLGAINNAVERVAVALKKR